MSDTEIFLDPVADGRPSRSKLLVGGAVIFACIGLYQIYETGFWAGYDNVLIGIWMYLADMSRRAGWLNGYKSAIDSLSEQVGVDDE